MLPVEFQEGLGPRLTVARTLSCTHLIEGNTETLRSRGLGNLVCRFQTRAPLNVEVQPPNEKKVALA